MVTLTRAQRAVIGAIAAGAVVIALIGFTGSYAAVQGLAVHKGFGWFSYALPVGVDVGIAVLLALDLLLTWLRIPFPLLRQTAWLLTAATIVFNAASAWPDPLATGMHAIIPVLFVVIIEAARHAVGRMADITTGKHMESVRLVRWLLSPVPTFRLWRRMKLWEMRSYEQVVSLEQARLVYRTRLRAQYGRAWRRRAPVELLLPLKLARYGVPLPELVPAGVRSLDDHADDAQAIAAAEPTGAQVTAPTLPDNSANFAEFSAAAETAGTSGNLPEVPPAAEAEQMATMAICAPIVAIAEPLVTSESPDLAFEVPEVAAEDFLTWLDGQLEAPGATEIPEPQVATESPVPEPDLAQVQAMKLAAGQADYQQGLRQKRQDAAEAWWQQLGGGTTPSHTEHARAFGISAPTLRKALVEFPEPVPEATP